jgi:hypothetical protein
LKVGNVLLSIVSRVQPNNYKLIQGAPYAGITECLVSWRLTGIHGTLSRILERGISKQSYKGRVSG